MALDVVFCMFEVFYFLWTFIIGSDPLKKHENLGNTCIQFNTTLVAYGEVKKTSKLWSSLILVEIKNIKQKRLTTDFFFMLSCVLPKTASVPARTTWIICTPLTCPQGHAITPHKRNLGHTNVVAIINNFPHSNSWHATSSGEEGVSSCPLKVFDTA